MQSKPKKYRKVYFTAENLVLLSEVKMHSKIVNMACSHLQFTMSATIEDIRIKFNTDEIEAITVIFRERLHCDENIYFVDIDEARAEIKRVNQDPPSETEAGWNSGYPILMKHSSITEINGLVYLSRFLKCTDKRAIDDLYVKFNVPEIEAIERAYRNYLPDIWEDEHFENLVEARRETRLIDEHHRSALPQAWKKAFPILVKHCTTLELNALVHLSKNRTNDQ